MIHIIGTAHSTQFWSDAIRQGELFDTCAAIVECFETYLRNAAISLNATVIAEENSEQIVREKEGGSSVAKMVAESLSARHVYCDPDRYERLALGVQGLEEREAIWMRRVQPFSPNGTSVVFVCGADHSLTFCSLLERNGFDARIHCQDWTVR